MSDRTFDDFDEFGRDYRSIHSKNIALSGADSFYFAEQKVLQIKKYEGQQRQSLLDVGCGDGAAEVFFNNEFSSWELHGIDVSETSIAQAVANNVPATFSTYDGVNIPFPSGAFDVVFVAAVLHHVSFSHHANLLEEIHRVLRPGGRLYVFEHNPLNPATNYLVKTCPFDKDAKLLSHGYTKRLLSSSGFNKLTLKFTIFFPRTTFFKRLLKIEDWLGWLPLGGQYFYRAVK